MAVERRGTKRIELAIPLRVQGYLGGGRSWDEISTTIDVSEGGVSFPLSHPVELGHVLQLSLALPKRFRRHDLNDTSYRVYVLVRSVRRREPLPFVGVMFFGKQPPRGFYQNQGGRYLLPGDPMPRRAGRAAGAGPAADGNGCALGAADGTGGALAAADGNWGALAAADESGAAEAAGAPEIAAASTHLPGAGAGAAGSPDGTAGEGEPPAGASPFDAPALPARHSREHGRGTRVAEERRRCPRVDLFVNFTLQQVDASGDVVQKELTVADNVGRGGARVLTTLALAVGDVVVLQELGGNFTARAEVRGVTRAPLGCERLHLRFLDRQAPDRLLR